MKKGKHSESAYISITVKPKNSWNEKVSAIRKSGIRKARLLRQKGHKFHLETLGPREVQGGDTVPLAGVEIKLDWKVETKIQMVNSANDMIANAYLVGSLDPAFPTVLKSIIEGTGLYEHGIGEFFVMYGKFEQKYQLGKQETTRAKMLELINGDKQHLRPYTGRRKTCLEPLPLAVRNILSHAGNNPNKLEPDDLRASIDLLRSWVNPK